MSSESFIPVPMNADECVHWQQSLQRRMVKILATPKVVSIKIHTSHDLLLYVVQSKV